MDLITVALSALVDPLLLILCNSSYRERLVKDIIHDKYRLIFNKFSTFDFVLKMIKKLTGRENLVKAFRK